MKILFLNEYAPNRPVSGAEYSQMALAQGLRTAETTVDVFTPGWKKNQPGEGLSPLWFNNPIYFIYSAWQIFRAVKKYRADLIHVHGKYILPGAIIAGWLTHKPVVTTVRDFKFLCPLALCFTEQQKRCSFNYYINKEIPEYRERYNKTAKWKLIFAKIWQYKLKWFLNQSNQVIA
ncbi:MAG: glycosyltransferase family 4 protein, partial [Patescibacteria group bacterium]|nr:glycosyltransferase family 4 protein [Patescibacteria group bacterium]